MNLELSFVPDLVKFTSRLLNASPANFLEIYTSGRFGEGSLIMGNMIEIINNSPFIGYGYGSVATSDFSLYEVLSISGMFGISLYLFVFVIMIVILFRIMDAQLSYFYFFLIVLTAFSSLAAPTITANRISIFFWIIFTYIAKLSFLETKQKSINLLNK